MVAPPQHAGRVNSPSVPMESHMASCREGSLFRVSSVELDLDIIIIVQAYKTGILVPGTQTRQGKGEGGDRSLGSARVLVLIMRYPSSATTSKKSLNDIVKSIWIIRIVRIGDSMTADLRCE